MFCVVFRYAQMRASRSVFKVLAVVSIATQLSACLDDGSGNEAPSASPIVVQTREDEPLAITVSGSDPNGDQLTFEIVSTPAHGRVEGALSGATFTYVPARDYFGADEVVFVTIDALGARSAEASVSIDISPVNDPPRMTLESIVDSEEGADFSVTEDSAGETVLAASDPEEEPVTYVRAETTRHGLLELDATTGRVVYTPEPNYHGPDEFTFLLQDPSGAQSQVYRFELEVLSANDVPVAQDARISLAEDGTGSVEVVAADVDGDGLEFVVAMPPAHGTATFARGNRELSYAPAADWNGTDRIGFIARDNLGASSAVAFVDVTVLPVADAPRITLASDATNSAYTEDTTVAYSVFDADDDEVTVDVDVDDVSVATVAHDSSNRTLLIHPLRRGSTNIVLHASDRAHATTANLTFEVTDVTKVVTLPFERPQEQAVVIRNETDSDLSFTLTHNGFPSFATLEDVVRYVEDMPEDFADEAFERKLWRFLIANVVHEYPLTEALWLQDPLVTVNSLGWGFCSNVANAYVRIARAAGREARVWGLGGHVVPEVRVDGKWLVYDPDLSVFYRKVDWSVAGIADLAAAPALITSPVDPLYPVVDPGPYGVYISMVYASTADNETHPRWDGPETPLSGLISLPAGASITYPGQWDDAPSGYNFPDIKPVEHFRHALVELPAGWSGTLRLPWMLRKITGTGRVRVGTLEYAIGDPALDARLQQPGSIIHELEILDSGSVVQLVFYVNVVRFAVGTLNEVRATGQDVWRLDVSSTTLPVQHRRGAPVPASALKSTPPARP
jgi:hypothetical protein